ncbi:MAG: helix-turn-helix transcriptional regulator [Lachnospiraceae bacterium]|nr:helix-turn-helix transcriptional regulator [Lachnospiraceae bacterium]
MEYRTLSEEYLEIGERIRKRRLELHLSQEQLAERAGISVNTLSRLECGQS